MPHARVQISDSTSACSPVGQMQVWRPAERKEILSAVASLWADRHLADARSHSVPRARQPGTAAGVRGMLMPLSILTQCPE